MFNRSILLCLSFFIILSVNAKNNAIKTNTNAKPFYQLKFIENPTKINTAKIVVFGYIKNTLAYQLQTIDKKDIAIVKYKNSEVTYMPIFVEKKIKIKKLD